MLVVNLFGGPGTGKSLLATRLFSDLKSKSINAEYVSEYAKALEWGREYAKLGDQLYVTAKQNRKLMRLDKRVDVAVTDAPLLLGLHYAVPEFLGNSYATLLHELFKGYDNLNIFVTRCFPYNTNGRRQSEAEAKAADANILRLLEKGGYPFVTVPARLESVPIMLELIGNELHKRKDTSDERKLFTTDNTVQN